jgi:hypothetical protein
MTDKLLALTERGSANSDVGKRGFLPYTQKV